MPTIQGASPQSARQAGCPPRSEIGAHLSRFAALAARSPASAAGLMFGSWIRPKGTADPEQQAVEAGQEQDWLLRYWACMTPAQQAKFRAASGLNTAAASTEAGNITDPFGTGIGAEIRRFGILIGGVVLTAMGIASLTGGLALGNLGKQIGNALRGKR